LCKRRAHPSVRSCRPVGWEGERGREGERELLVSRHDRAMLLLTAKFRILIPAWPAVFTAFNRTPCTTLHARRPGAGPVAEAICLSLWTRTPCSEQPRESPRPSTRARTSMRAVSGDVPSHATAPGSSVPSPAPRSLAVLRAWNRRAAVHPHPPGPRLLLGKCTRVGVAACGGGGTRGSRRGSAVFDSTLVATLSHEGTGLSG
jgi:hypothetical protein